MIDDRISDEKDESAGLYTDPDLYAAATDAAGTNIAGTYVMDTDAAGTDAAGTDAADTYIMDTGAAMTPGTETDIIEDCPDPDDDVSKLRMELYDWLQCIVFAVICGIFIFMFFGRTIGVEGDSMLQTLHYNDRIIMSNLFYSPKNGDIVVFRAPSDVFGGTPLVKRIIAVEGQTIDINFDTGEVFIDGVVQYEPYINELTHTRLSFQGPYTVPEGHVFVMGDNRNRSSDSRDARIGPVDTRYILGKVLFVVIPGRDSYTPRDWSRVGPAKH